MELQISFVIATYNAAATLADCLDSIVSQLTSECELIVIDGGSDDATTQIIQSYSSHIAYTISERDKGIYDAWNKGVKVARGQWIAFIGADDILLPDAINEYMTLIKSKDSLNAYDYICAHVEFVDYAGNLLKILGKEPRWSLMRKRMCPAHVASLHNKKNLFDTIGLFDYINFHICADYELLLRKRDRLKYLMIPAHIAQMKVGGMSFTTKAIIETYKIREYHHSVSPLFNKLLLLSDLFFYGLFILRKKILGKKI